MLCSASRSRFNEAAGFTRRKRAAGARWSPSGCCSFNEAAGFTRRKLDGAQLAAQDIIGFNEAAGFTRRKLIGSWSPSSSTSRLQ